MDINKLLTTTLRNGQTVTAKVYGAHVFATTYANRTQAERAAAKLCAAGIPADVVQFMGRPFFVRVEVAR
jgi:hypothetical protein